VVKHLAMIKNHEDIGIYISPTPNFWS